MTGKVATAAERAVLKASLEKQLAELNAEEADAANPKDDGDETDNQEEPGEGTPEEEKKDKDEAKAIAASAEAKTHPHFAMAAIASGQTLAQFKATVEAAANAPKRGALAEVLANAQRLGPDAPNAEGSKMGELLVANAKSRNNKAA